MQLLHLLRVYSIFLTVAEGINREKKGNIKDVHLSGLAQTDLLKTAMVCSLAQLLSFAQITERTLVEKLVL